jgi:hypothetical protein
LFEEDRFEVPLESFQKLDDSYAGNLACALASSQGRAYFYLS